MSSQPAVVVGHELHDAAPATVPKSASRDPLTGFRTQEYFVRRLDRLIERRAWRHKPLTLGLLQLANFYEISAWIGNSDARLLLYDLARLLRKTVPANTRLCRCHNLEFAILLIDEGSRKAPLISESIQQTLATEGARLVPPQLRLVCGRGFVRIGPETPSAGVAFARARHAIGRSRLAPVTPGVMPGTPGDQDPGLAGCLDSALRNREFQLSYQAIVSFREDGLRRYELRARLPRGAVELPANAFMDTVVHLALGERLDRLVIGCAIEQLERDADEADLLTVNLSQNSLTSRDFSAWLETTVPVSLAARLILQVSEVDALTAQHHLVRLRECARRIGIGLGVSHFGLMDDPLLYLPLLEARIVTLDGGLLDSLDVDTGRRDRLEALVARLHKRGIRVIAPLVEDFSVLPILWRAGIDLVQGHCLHAPSRRRDFEFVEDVELSTR